MMVESGGGDQVESKKQRRKVVKHWNRIGCYAVAPTDTVDNSNDANKEREQGERENKKKEQLTTDCTEEAHAALGGKPDGGGGDGG